MVELLTSKKTLSAAFIINFPVSVIFPGTTISSEPSFGVSDFKVIVSEKSPTAENKICTDWQFTVAVLLVFATSQVIVSALP